MERIRTYLNSLSPDHRDGFVKRCRTTVGYLRKVACIKSALGMDLAIHIDKESDGELCCEDLNPSIDWDYVEQWAISRRRRREMKQ